MAIDTYITVIVGTKQADGTYNHVLSHASASAGDAVIGWDHTKFTTKAAIRDLIQKLNVYLGQRGDLT